MNYPKTHIDASHYHCEECELYNDETSDDCQHGQGFSSGDQCNIFQDNREAAQNHRGSSDGDEEEIYVVTKSNNGKVEFECKLCDKTFDTQKSVKQHGTMKHGSFY